MAAAAAQSNRVLALFVLDPALLAGGGPRVAYALATVEALKKDLHAHGGLLVLRTGKPQDVVPQVAAEANAISVHISEDFTPYGVARDQRVQAALDIPLVRTGSPYAVSPGRVTKGDGDPYKVFTPFSRAWLEHGWRGPADTDPGAITWRRLPSEDLPEAPEHDVELPGAGERAAHERWDEFLTDQLQHYPQDRDRPDRDGTSRMSAHLKLGTIHPRTMLADLTEIGSDAAGEFKRQLCWREFYGAVLHHWPDSAHGYFQPAMATMSYDDSDADFDAWATGNTGFPIVDAGMRQLLATGWMHNRVRMLAASFLVKDLHQEWTRGAAHFMAHLIDGDLANNQHGWQWTAGTGTDAAPYFRIFNPVRQGERFDPDGAYVKKWIPELKDLPAKLVHHPWDAPDGVPPGYASPMVDHDTERRVALDRYKSR